MAMYILTSPDDPEYQRAFTALDELNLASLKPFFKEHFLQVTTTASNFSLFTSVHGPAIEVSHGFFRSF